MAGSSIVCTCALVLCCLLSPGFSRIIRRQAVDSSTEQLPDQGGSTEALLLAETDSQPPSDVSGTDPAVPGTEALPGTAPDSVSEPGNPPDVPGTDPVADPGTESAVLPEEGTPPADSSAVPVPGSEPSSLTESGPQTNPVTELELSSEVQPGSEPSSESLPDSSTGTGSELDPSSQAQPELEASSESEPGSDPPLPGSDPSLPGSDPSPPGSDPSLPPEPEPSSEAQPEPSSVSGTEPDSSVVPDNTPGALPETEPSSLVSEPETESATGTEAQTDGQGTSAQSIPPIPIGGTVDSSVVGTEAIDIGSLPGIPTMDSDVFPFEGGFVFDSPFFNFSQIEDYFKKLEKAMEKIFKDTMLEVGSDPDVYKNTTERVVDVDGSKYRVHTTVIKGGDKNNAVSIEAVSAIPENKRRKRSLF